MEEKTYIIGGRTYIQRPLVLAQIRQLEQILRGIPWGAEFNSETLVALIGDKLPLALAVVLRPRAPWPLRWLYEPRRKNLRRLARRLSFGLDVATTYEVIADFFTCNPARSLFRRLLRDMAATGAIPKTTAPTASSSSPSPSAPVTSPEETQSCGDAPSPSAAPGCATGSGRSSSARASSPSSE